MTYKQFFKESGIDKAFAIAVATDALGRKANTLAVTLSPIYYHNNSHSIFVAGGDVHANTEFTGIDPIAYTKDCYGLGGAKEQLDKALDGCTFVVSYAVRYFTQAQLVKTFPEIFMNKTIIDVVSMKRARDLGVEQELCAKSQSFNELCYNLEVEMQNYRGGMKLGECLDSCGLPLSTLPLYQAQAVNAASLFQYLVQN